MDQRTVKTTVMIPEDLYLLARHYGLNNLSEFVRNALQGFVDGQEEPVSDTVAIRARQIAVDLRLKSLQQRKILQDAELEREMKEQALKTRLAVIEQATRAEVYLQNFQKTNLPEYDDHYLSSETTRKKLVDEISHKCEIDLQWKDIDHFVRQAVRP